MASIKSSIIYLNQTLSQVQTDPNVQIVALSDALADERYTLSILQQTHVLPLSLKSVNCTNISAESLNQIQISIQQIKGDLENLNNSIITL